MWKGKLEWHPLDLFEDARVLCDTHAEEFLRSPVLVQNIISILPELLHVSPDEHLSELDEVAVLLVIDLDDTPWVRPPAYFTTIRGLDNLIRADDSERNLAGNLLGFSNGFLVFIFICGCLEDVNVVVGNISQNLSLLLLEYEQILRCNVVLTRALKSTISSSVNVSALAMMGIKLTFV
jgi:hypothetical protein